ncbi:MAG: DUF1427 family protein [Terriglobales bacterium]
MVNYVIGLAMAFGIGAACRWFELPVPAPPKLLGALLVVAMTMGYIGVDRFKASRATNSPAVQAQSAEVRGADVPK